jgi:hypothetical protein
MSDKKQFQKRLAKDTEMKRQFVDSNGDDEVYDEVYKDKDYIPSDNSDSDSSDSEDECQTNIKITKNRKNTNIDNELFHQLVAQQKKYTKAMKKIYKLKSEIDVQEIKERYLKLDLNNAQVKTTEAEDELAEIKKTLWKSKVENYISRGCLFLCSGLLLTSAYMIHYP